MLINKRASHRANSRIKFERVAEIFKFTNCTQCGGAILCMLVRIEIRNKNLGAYVALVRRALLASGLFNDGFTGTLCGGHGGWSDPEAVRGEFSGGWRGEQWLEYWVEIGMRSDKAGSSPFNRPPTWNRDTPTSYVGFQLIGRLLLPNKNSLWSN